MSHQAQVKKCVGTCSRVAILMKTYMVIIDSEEENLDQLECLVLFTLEQGRDNAGIAKRSQNKPQVQFLPLGEGLRLLSCSLICLLAI